MKTTINYLLSLLYISLASSAFGQSDYGKSVVKVLASDKYAGRGYLFGGDKKAAAYIAGQMKKSGLEPLGKRYMQHFTLGANVFPKAPVVQWNKSKLQVAREALIEAGSPSVRGSFQVTKFSGSIKDADERAKIIADPTLHGKALYIVESEQLKTMDAQSLRKALVELMGDGYYNAIVVETEAKFTWRASTVQYKKPAVYIRPQQSLAAGDAITLDILAKYQPAYQTQNVCGYLKGTSDSDSTILVTAHYDHLGAMGKKIVFNGANDNASGTALMLYLAKYYGQNRPKYNMIFLAFSGEESGLLGSKHYANNPLNDLSKIKFLLNLDMAGTGDDGIQVVNGTEFKKEFELMTTINEQRNYVPKVLIRGPMNRSDHAPFFEKGVPSFFIYTLGGIAAYHDIDDRFETLPFTAFDGYGSLLKDFIQELN